MAKGEILSVLGDSGSGKTTVLRLIAGLEVPKGGTIKIEDRVMVDRYHFVQPENRGIGVVFQDYALFPHMTVATNVGFGLRRMSKQDKNRTVAEALELVNLADYGARYPHELSGGQQQRVALARALAPAPALLLMDEPFSSLDRELHHKIRDELKPILKHTSTTAIFVTHDAEDAISIADRVLLLQAGRIVKVGDPQTVLGPPR